ncbi:hypothetical protein [Crossiella cryophila]|uniref:Tat pathway signal sequence domain protein n=1 Tax=Crossiella cryophila TaxID=43355 RepID=A0A7W7CA58_9PSEU|nr:hypothetical protein [Crossiella cryophila]MBB4677368.1 hypothetical protein [Crossiella cryophila]
MSEEPNRIDRRKALKLGAFGALAAGGLATPLPALATPAYTSAVEPRPADWALRWNPSPAVDKLQAFEGLEDDRSGSHKGVKHIHALADHWRFDMHTRDRDGSDRQRNESKGMRSGGTLHKIQEGQTWRITYQTYIPSALTATTKFSHIFQMKVQDVGGPLITMTLRERNGPKIEMLTLRDDDSNTVHSPVPLTPLQNKWIDIEFEVKAVNSGGYVRWVIKDGGRVVQDYRTTAVDMWRNKNYLRPKWGIYRSIESAGLKDCYQLIRGYKGYILQ